MWQIKTFDQLNTLELFYIYRARVDVFVVEQTCAYPEIDETDREALHLFQVNENDQIKAYCRLIPDEDIIKLGRVLVAKSYRGQGLGYLCPSSNPFMCFLRTFWICQNVRFLLGR